MGREERSAFGQDRVGNGESETDTWNPASCSGQYLLILTRRGPAALFLALSPWHCTICVILSARCLFPLYFPPAILYPMLLLLGALPHQCCPCQWVVNGSYSHASWVLCGLWNKQCCVSCSFSLWQSWRSAWHCGEKKSWERSLIGHLVI